MLVSPGVTPYDNTNPGVGLFEISSEGRAQNLHLEFFYLQSTIGLETLPNYDEIEFLSIDFPTKYNVTSLDAESLNSWF